MTDPVLKKTAVKFGYTASDGYRMSFEAKGGTGTKNLRTGEEVPPEKALLESFEELARILVLFGFGDQAKERLQRARKNVEDWRALLGWTGETHTTQPAESLAGIAIRQLGDEGRWREIADLNADRFPDKVAPDYYPVGTVLKIPQRRAP